MFKVIQRILKAEFSDVAARFKSLVTCEYIFKRFVFHSVRNCTFLRHLVYEHGALPSRQMF